MIAYRGLATEIKFSLLTLAIMASLIYSTSLHLFWNREATLRLEYYFEAPDHYRAQNDFPNVGLLRSRGIPPEQVSILGPDAWKLSNFAQDCAYYLTQVNHLGNSYPPYKYRILAPLMAGAIARLTGWSAGTAFVALNCLCALLTGWLFTAYLRWGLGLSPLLGLLGGVLALTSLAMMRTLPFPMIEPATMLVSLAVFAALRQRDPLVYALVCCLAVLTKEIFLFAVPMWLYARWPRIATGQDGRWWRHLAALALPVVVFVLSRVLLGGGALEVDYGYDLLHWHAPPHALKFLGLGGVAHYAWGVFLAFGFLWIGLAGLGGDTLTLRAARVAVPLVLLATALFSGRISRVIGLIYPVVIPGMLFLLRDAMARLPGSAGAQGPAGA